MKKYLLLLFISAITFAQNPTRFPYGVQITGGITTANDATKVVVHSANDVLNTISKVDLQDAFYFASASAFPVTGITDKLYITRDDNKLYRFNGTVYVTLSADVSGKEDIANKSSSFAVSSTTTYPNTKALVDGLATKQNTITGTTNVIPKFGTGGVVGSQIFDDGTNIGIGTTTPTDKLSVNGSGIFRGVTSDLRLSNDSNGNSLIHGTGVNKGINMIVSYGGAPHKLATFSAYADRIYEPALVLENHPNILNSSNKLSFGEGTEIYRDNNKLKITSFLGTEITGLYDGYNFGFNQTNVGAFYAGEFSYKSKSIRPAENAALVDRFTLNLAGNFGFYKTNPLAEVHVGGSQIIDNALLIRTVTNNGIDALQVNGNISASPATLSNQVVVKSQLDLKANLAGTQTFTGIHNFPTATAGTNTTQVATTAFVLANGGSGTTTLQNTYDNTANGTILIGASKPLILKNSISSGPTKILSINTLTDVESISVLGNGIIDIKSSGGALILSANSSYTSASTPTLVNKNGLFTIFGSSSVSPTLRSGVSFDLATNTANTLRTLSIPSQDGVIALEGNTAKQLKDHFTVANNTGTTETDLYSYTVASNRLNSTGEKIIANYAGTFNDVSASSQIRIYFANTLIGDTGALTMSTTGAFVVTVSIMRTGATTSTAIVNITTPGASTATYTKYTSFTGEFFENAKILKITGTAAGATGGSDDISATYGNILWQPAAL